MTEFFRTIVTLSLAAFLTGSLGVAQSALPDTCSSVELQYWTPFTGPDGPFMGQIVDSFNAANPDVRVTMSTIPGGEYSTQLGTAAASGTLPDVAVINEDQVATQAFRNVLRPMDEDFISRLGFGSEDFPEVAWNAGEVAGQRYAVPLSFVVMTMFYNADLLEAAGLDAPPTNAEEFDRAATAITESGNNGFLITTGFPNQQIFQQLLHQYGGTEFSEDGTEATWNSEAGVRALEWMRNAQQQYGEENLEVDAELNAFKTGTTGMIWNGIWQVPNLTGDAVEFSGRAAPVPQIGDQPAVWAGGPLLALPATEPDACRDAAAATFIRYVLENSLEWARAGNVPALNEVRNSAEFQELPHAVVGPSADNPVFPPSLPGIGDAFVPLAEAISSILSGTSADIQQALDDAAARSNAILEQNRSTYGDAPSN